MKIALTLRSLTCLVALSATLFTGALTAHAAEPSTFGKCVFPSSFVLRNLVRQIVLNDLIAKGFKAPTATVTITTKNLRTALKQSNITGLTSVTSKPDGSYLINTSGPLSVPCAAEATVTIKGLYTDTAGARKNYTSTQTVQVNGAFN